MKILLVGSDFEFGIERYYIKYLRDFGADVIHYPAPDIVMRQRLKNLLNRGLFKTGIYTGYDRVNKELIRLAADHQPDVIWIFKGMEIFPATLKQLAKTERLANYNPDHPFIISSKGSGNRNVTDSVGLYHLHFCYNYKLLRQLEQSYPVKTAFLPFGFELAPADFQSACGEPEIKKICFIGNPDKTRIQTLALLVRNGFSVDVYGHGWYKTSLNGVSNLSIFDAVYGPEFWKKLRQYRVQINIFRQHNLGSHNMRTFEIPAIGGIQLAPYSEEQQSFFTEGREIFFYRTATDLLSQAKALLAAPAEQADQYRQAARKRSLDSHHSYRDRAMTVYENFKQWIG